MKLANCRDVEMWTYTWFYVGDTGHVVSPYFETEAQALIWFEQVFEGAEEQL
jgi:hypothetical protein